MSADNIRNLAGTLSGDSVSLSAKQDIDNMGGLIKGVSAAVARTMRKNCRHAQSGRRYIRPPRPLLATDAQQDGHSQRARDRCLFELPPLLHGLGLHKHMAKAHLLHGKRGLVKLITCVDSH